jgi:hypothetical protein
LRPTFFPTKSGKRLAARVLLTVLINQLNAFNIAGSAPFNNMMPEKINKT